MSDYFKQELSDFKNNSKKLRQDLLNYFRGIEFGSSTLYDPANWDSMVHYWPFNGDANDVVGSLDFTASGSPNYVNGVDGQGVEGDGADDSLLATPGSLPTDSISIFSWMSVVSGNNNGSPIFGFYDTTNGEGIANIGIKSAGIGADIRDQNSVQSVSSSITYGTKKFVGFTYDGSTLTLWIDGSSVDSISLTSSTINSTNLGIAALGESNFGVYTSLNYLDEGSVFNKALSESEIDTLYQAGV